MFKGYRSAVELDTVLLLELRGCKLNPLPIRTLLTAIFLATVVGGCAPNRLYPGPPRPADQVAIIDGDSGINHQRTVVSINGHELDLLRGQRYELEPGGYKVAITCSEGFWIRSEMLEPCDVDYVFEAGHRYSIELGISGPRWWVYLLDTSTGKEIPCEPRRPAYYE